MILPECQHIIDLTHPIKAGIPTWDGISDDVLSLHSKRDLISQGCGFCLQHVDMSLGLSTHIDSPFHLYTDGKSVDKISLDSLIRPLYTINVSKEIHSCDYILTGDRIQVYEREHGFIPPYCHVIVYTGWAMRWNSPELYRNDLQFPSLSKDAAEYLLEKKILSLGVDTLSPDAATSDFPVHKILLRNDVFIIENLALFAPLPTQGALLGVFPMQLQGSTEAPSRVLAFY